MVDKENFEKDINVPSKEQIICKYKYQDDKGYNFKGKPYCTCFNELCEDISIVCDHNCQIYEDFKQLARKTQECEELKRQHQSDKGLITETGKINYQLLQEYDKLKAENEELKKKCNIYTCGICGNKEDCNKLYKTLTDIKEIIQIKFYNKFTPKEQNEKFGIIAVHFEPFEDMDYVWEQDHDTYTIEECQETLKEYCHSTIYQGFRYFFNSLENLKKFCEIAEKGIL